MGIVVEELETATECTVALDQLGSQEAADHGRSTGRQTVDVGLACLSTPWPGQPWYVYSQIVAREARLRISVRSRAGRGW